MQLHRLKIMMKIIALIIPLLVITSLAIREKQVVQGRVSGNLDVSLPSDFGHAISPRLFFPFVFIHKLFIKGIILFLVSSSEVGKKTPPTLL